MNSNFFAIANCLLVLVVASSGCGDSGPPSLADYNNTNIRKLRGAYGMFLIAHDLRGPKSEEEFKEYLTTNPSAIAKMERTGVPQEKIPDIFISERDGQPFKVRYGLNGLEDHPIVFESVGVDGKRFVAFTTPREVENDEYEQLLAGKVKAVSGMDMLGESAK